MMSIAPLLLSLGVFSIVAAANPSGFLRHRRSGGKDAAAADGAPDVSSSAADGRAETQCRPCPVCDARPSGSNNGTATAERIKLRFLTADLSFTRLRVMLERMADDYTRKLGLSAAPEITIVGVHSLSELEREVKFDVLNGASQFDGYIITPLWIGELASGLFQTGDFMKEYSTMDPNYWTDILLFYREVISSYDNKLYLFPFDGDVISLFYRRDLLERYGKDVPRTWEEYNELAAFFHGKSDTIYDEDDGFVKNVTLSGSCIGRTPECGVAYWAQTVLATMTQVRGTYEGSLLDSSDLSTLLGPAMEETLRIQGEQTKYGVPDEFDGCVDIPVEAMNRGECVLTYNWGNSFSDHIREGSMVRRKLGVAPIPGSPVVLNRKTGKLEECMEETCPYAVVDERTGKLINQAPYGAYGGWSGAVSASVSKEHQIAAAEFFAFATSAKKAIPYVIPDANNPDANSLPTGMDPYAKSMLRVDEWTSRGFDLKSTEEYVFAIESQLDSENAVIDLRMPAASDFMSALDVVTTKYCNGTKFNKFENEDLASIRDDLSNELARQWRDIITKYDSAEGREEGALLELYQRDRGVYVARESSSTEDVKNALSSDVIVAIILCAVAVISIVILFIVYFVKNSSAENREHMMWYVNPNDIMDTKVIVGRGSFGVVTKGFLRGTPVALKHAKGWEAGILMAKGSPVDEKKEMDEPGNDPQGERQIHPRKKSLASSTSLLSEVAPGVDDSTVMATLLTEPGTERGICHYFRRSKKQKTKSADDSLRAELLLLVKLRHDNIVQTFGASQNEKKKQLVLILQYMENGSIRQAIKDPNGVVGTAGMSLEMQWALQVARGMNFLHTIPPPAGPMVHADLKSSNVLLDSCYNANISDFGLATKTMRGLWGAIQRSTKSNNPRGSILWMAPEVLNGADPTPASDVYSYSMFLVELMTRDRPYGVRTFDVNGADSQRSFSLSMSDSGDEGRDSDAIIRDDTRQSVDGAVSSEDDQTTGPDDATLLKQKSKDPEYAEFIHFLDNSTEEPAGVDRCGRKHDKLVRVLNAHQDTTAAADSVTLWQQDTRLKAAVSVEDAPTTRIDNATKLNQTKRRQTRRHVSWSGPTPQSPEVDGSSKNTSVAFNSKLTRFGSKDYFAEINGETLTRDEIVNRIKDLTLDPPFRPNLPDNAPQILVDICTECWQKNPKRRPTMKEVEERLEAVVSSTSLTQQLMKRGSVFDSILPPDIQDKLAKGEMVKPKTYNEVTVFFSDIVGFTSISSALTAEETGDLIFRLFTKFDGLCKANGVKKLDVIGDAFLGVVGVPHAMPSHASRAARFALSAIAAAQETLICPRIPQLGYTKVRFGLSSGSAVATVIGSREHPKYTLFGDTVNTASRMESTSLPNKCQVTKATADLIRSDNDGSDITVIYRGKTEVKGKGKMDTFFVE